MKVSSSKPIGFLIILLGWSVNLLFPSSLMAVDCSSTDIDLVTQAEVDNFQSTYGGGGTCDTVTGHLRIRDMEVVDLAPLSDLTRIGGNLQIVQTSVTDLGGLSALSQVGGSFDLRDNLALVDLDGLASLTSVGGALQIIGNNTLTNLDGLSALASVRSTLRLKSNAELSDLGGLSALSGISALDIEGNAVLTDLEGLSGIRTLGFLSIRLNPMLVDLGALSNLTSAATAYIELNDSLANLDGLAALAEVGTSFKITRNPALANLDGLVSLRSTGNLLLEDNNQLMDCLGLVTLVDPIDDYEPGPGPGSSGVPDVADVVRIQNNGTGCQSIAGILGEAPLLAMNSGLNDAWFNLQTDGQGFLIIVFPDIGQVFLAWFTYDTERPPKDVTAILGDPGHRWLTAQGDFEENSAELTLYLTSGGVFDSAVPRTVTEPYGEIQLEFSSCNAGTVSYDIPSTGEAGVVPIERIVLDNVAMCYLLDTMPSFTQ